MKVYGNVAEELESDANYLTPASEVEEWLSSKYSLGCVSEQWSSKQQGIWHVMKVSLEKTA